MTLCIAAVCQDRAYDRIIVASDWRIETPIAGAEIQNKLYWIDDMWPVLIAGGVSRALELVRTYRQHWANLVSTSDPVTELNIIDLVKAPALRQKQKLAQELVATELGVTYEEFLRNGASYFGEDTRRQIIYEITRLRLDCQLILATFVGRTPYIFKVNSDCSVEFSEHFAAIGSGDTVAESILFKRAHSASLPLGKSLYHVFEAMTFGSIAPGVGTEFAMSILSPPTRGEKELVFEIVNDKGQQFLERKYKNKLGPKDFSNLKFNRDLYLERA